MKKLLLCALTAFYGLALHAMDEKSQDSSRGLYANLAQSLSLLNGLKTVPGVVFRHMVQPQTDNPTVDVVIDDQVPTAAQAGDASTAQQTDQSGSTSSSSSASTHQDQPSGLRTGVLSLRVNPCNSWSRISIANPYPADEGDDTWDIVTKHDAKEAKVLDTAQTVLLQAQSLVPEDLKPHIKPNLHDSSNPLKELETARELIWACMTRTAPTFATDYVETLTKNFGPCKQYDADFDPSKVYAYFAYDNAVAMNEPNETFAQLIKEKLEKAVAVNDEKTQWFMRQFGFMFRDPATKQTYDAYLKGGIDALNALRISEAQNETLQACFDEIAEAKYALKDLQKSKK